jgi:hypothetical protein
MYFYFILQIKFLNKCEWIVVGVWDRKIVEKNNYECEIGKKNVKKKNQGTL